MLPGDFFNPSLNGKPVGCSLGYQRRRFFVFDLNS
jgi:hypothetical protein